MPAMFAVGVEVIGNPAVATFAAFGSFAMLLLVDFARADARSAAGAGGARGHRRRVRLRRHAGLAFGVACCGRDGAGGVRGVFAGVVSSVLAGATTSLLLAFILPVSLPGPRLLDPGSAGRLGSGGGGGALAVALLWPAPARDPGCAARDRGVPGAGGASAR